MNFLRALAVFLFLPVVVGLAIPQALVSSDSWNRGSDPVGLALAIAGFAGLVWSISEFYRVARRTLEPWAAPRRLVTSGPYRFLRNPMYVAALTLVIGQAWWLHSLEVALYSAVLAVMFYLRVTLYEEPWLASTFARDWDVYKARVGRWGPKSLKFRAQPR